MKVTVQERQTLADIAIQVYGDIRAAVAIATANHISVTAELSAGMMIECPDISLNPYMQDYVRKNSLTPATELSDKEKQIL